jgi:hypothetical protein
MDYCTCYLLPIGAPHCAFCGTQRFSARLAQKIKAQKIEALEAENIQLRGALEYLKLQMRLIPQSRLDKWSSGVNDTTAALWYRTATYEIDRLNLAAIQHVNEMCPEGSA